ncbi:MAG: glycoside hydrolase family 127 protein [Bacteroidota bacterium]|nr:glycoside hydrolase family 127 protein [Bacteroidota bacterium]
MFIKKCIISSILLSFCFFTGVNAQIKKQVPRPVNFADIKVGGDLSVRATRNFERLHDDIYKPENVFPLVVSPNSASWPGDYEGRIIMGLVLEGQALHSEPKYLQQMIDLIPSKVNSKGYLGPIMKDSVMEQQLSGHGWFLRALCEYYTWKKDPKVKGYIQNIIQNLVIPTTGAHRVYPIRPEERLKAVGGMSGSTQNTIGKWMLSSDIGCDFIFMDGVIQAYELCPSKKLKAVVDEMVNRFLEMDIVKIQAQTHASLTATRGLLRYYAITGSPRLLQQAKARYDLYRKVAMTENFENFNWFDRPEWTEPCAIVDSYMVATQLWEYTQDPSYLEDAQHIYYNALGHAQRANGGFGCDNCPGPHADILKVHADEAYWCCTMRGGEGLAKAISYSYFLAPGAIYVSNFNSSLVSLKTTSGNLTLQQESGYPFDGVVKLNVVKSGVKKPIAIKFFSPSWTANPKLTINQHPVAFKKDKGFLTISYIPKDGDKIVLTFDQKAEAKSMINEKYNHPELYSFYYGPLLLGYEGNDIPATAKNDQVVKISDSEFILKGKSVRLSPVCHLLNANVSSGSGYQKRILFKESR